MWKFINEHPIGNDIIINENRLYDNVILHVVLECDTPVNTASGELLPCLELSIDERLVDEYEKLQQSTGWIACEQHFHKQDPFLLKIWQHSLIVERLEMKINYINQIYRQTNSDWNETFYRLLARNFGFKVNSDPFEMLARSVPMNILMKHRDNLFQIEALLFGQSGMLNNVLLGDDYFLKLRDEYSFLYQKYGLRAIESHQWKFLRLRPVNFPTIRIAQFAALICCSHALFSYLQDAKSLKEIVELFNVKASKYWDVHYNFNQPSVKKVETFGFDSDSEFGD